MAECIILKGGGADLDVITAGVGDVVAGKVIVDKDGEPVTGTLAEMNDTTFGGIGDDAYATSPIVGTGQNANVGAFDYNLYGYKKGKLRVHIPNATSQNIKAGVKIGGPNGYVEGTFTSDATVGGPAHILAGKTAYVNGVKVTGNIPYQNAETGGDRAWATNMSNWAGTINLGVRNGYYLNGVNWIQRDIPNYQPWNIKKGVNIGGVVGTFEGYIANPSDLYYKGINPVGFYSTNENYVIFDAAQITLPDRNMNSDLYIKSSSNVSLVGYSYINIHYVCTGTTYGYTPVLRFMINNDETLGLNYLSKGDFTLSINVVAYQKNGIVGIRMGKWSGYIDRIWLT